MSFTSGLATGLGLGATVVQTAKAAGNAVSQLSTLFNGGGNTPGIVTPPQAPDPGLTLDDYIFVDFEAPDSIQPGGVLLKKVHQLIGGARQIDVMGVDLHNIAWQARFRGPQALNHAQYLDSKFRAAQPLNLTWDNFSYQVLIDEYQYKYLTAWELEYSISLLIISDNLQVQSGYDDPSLDQMVAVDTGAMSDISANLNALTSALGGISAAIRPVVSAVSAVVTAVQTAGALIGNVAGLQSVASALLASSSAIAAATLISEGNVAALGILKASQLIIAGNAGPISNLLINGAIPAANYGSIGTAFTTSPTVLPMNLDYASTALQTSMWINTLSAVNARMVDNVNSELGSQIPGYTYNGAQVTLGL